MHRRTPALMPKDVNIRVLALQGFPPAMAEAAYLEALREVPGNALLAAELERLPGGERRSFAPGPEDALTFLERYAREGELAPLFQGFSYPLMLRTSFEELQALGPRSPEVTGLSLGLAEALAQYRSGQQFRMQEVVGERPPYRGTLATLRLLDGREVRLLREAGARAWKLLDLEPVPARLAPVLPRAGARSRNGRGEEPSEAGEATPP